MPNICPLGRYFFYPLTSELKKFLTPPPKFNYIPTSTHTSYHTRLKSFCWYVNFSPLIKALLIRVIIYCSWNVCSESPVLTYRPLYIYPAELNSCQILVLWHAKTSEPSLQLPFKLEIRWETIQNIYKICFFIYVSLVYFLNGMQHMKQYKTLTSHVIVFFKIFSEKKLVTHNTQALIVNVLRVLYHIFCGYLLLY